MKYALIGEKLGHSLSKMLHNEFFKIIGEDSSYDLIEIDKNNFEAEFKNVISGGYKGINVTIPYKFDVMEYLDEIDDTAKKIGAVNTVLTDGKKVGYNTDFYGIIVTYEKFNIKITNSNVVILGTGGASKAVEASCEKLNAKSITYVSRDKSKKLNYKVIDYSQKISGDVLINATPVGMYPNTDKSPIDDILSFNAVVDLIYNPYETKLIKKAKEQGITSVNGLYMLIAQGIYSQSLWHNKEFDRKIIDNIYETMKTKVENK